MNVRKIISGVSWDRKAINNKLFKLKSKVKVKTPKVKKSKQLQFFYFNYLGYLKEKI